LTRGYLGNDALTRERFITNPLTRAPDDRLYRTGDLGHYLPDGSVAYAGRRDRQVKIRGFRVELEEIETVLRRHPDVRESVVLCREDRPGEESLVAYLVADRQPPPSISGLRHFLSQQLPEYLVPAAFVTLDALPLTPNGKLDHQALPAPAGGRPDLESAFVAPRTPVEELLAEIWAELLGMERVGIHDNFFELGGNSLLATRAISRVRNVLQAELPLRSLFEAPTVAELTPMITRILEEAVEEEEIARMLAELEQLTEDEAQMRLATEAA
jgi:hypothetical protein